MENDIEKMPRTLVGWIISKKNGEIVNTFSKPELITERILSLTMMGHEEIVEVWPGNKINYLGSFLEGRGPF
jgi:hypothetical protein